MAGTQRVALDQTTLLTYQKQYHAQKRLSEALFGLFSTLGSALNVDRVANVGLLTLTGQLLIKCAAFFHRNDSSFRLLATVGARDLDHVEIPVDLPAITSLFQERTLVELEAHENEHPIFTELRARGFGRLFPLADGAQPLGIIALGDKIVPGPMTADDRQILNAFGVVISTSLKNSVAYEMMEASRNELERLNEMKRDFLDHVSHEFRTPLTVLKSILDMVEMEPEVDEMRSSALSRLEQLIDSILLLNEINSSGIQLDLEVLDGRTWVENTIQPLLDPHECFDLHDDLPECPIQLDRFKIRMAIGNVVENAVKFASDRVGGEVWVYLSTRRFVAERMEHPTRHEPDLEPGFLRPDTTVDPGDPKAMLVLEVKDLGIGIPLSELEAVFEPFTQAANSPTRGVRGAGLGLAMSKRIVDAHGGEIFCRSSVGHGTVFYLAIPVTSSGSTGTERLT